MRPMLPKLIFVTPIMMALILSASLAPAQPAQLFNEHKTIIGFDLLIPQFNNGESENLSGSAMLLSFRTKLNDGVKFVGELPLAHGSYSSYYGYKESEDVIGNPYIGIESSKITDPVLFEIGISPPVTSDNNPLASTVGIFSDITRIHDFAPKYLIGRAMIDFRKKSESGIAVLIKAGPTLWLNTGGDEYSLRDNDEEFLNYGGQVWYEGSKINVGAGLSGITVLSGESLIDESRTDFQFEVGASVNFKNVRPGLSLRVPLSQDLKDAINSVIGFNIQFQM